MDILMSFMAHGQPEQQSTVAGPLCDVCHAIDFAELLFPNYSYSDEIILDATSHFGLKNRSFPLGNLVLVSRRASEGCTFCTLLLTRKPFLSRNLAEDERQGGEVGDRVPGAAQDVELDSDLEMEDRAYGDKVPGNISQLRLYLSSRYHQDDNRWYHDLSRHEAPSRSDRDKSTRLFIYVISEVEDDPSYDHTGGGGKIRLHNASTDDAECDSWIGLFDHLKSKNRTIQPRLNYGIIRAWAARCTRSHMNCSHPVDSLKTGVLQAGLQLVKTAIGIEKPALSGDHFKLIDVSEKHIVELPLQEYPRYFTLSYVWGSDNSNCQLTKDKIHWTQDGKGRRWTPLPGMPPATILDAMKVVENLGYRYLWVDSLCITQDDPVETQLQIQQMASIYANAAICIVAAAGLSPRTGLPGVSSSRKYLQSIARINGNTVLGAFLPNFRRMVMETKWGSRAWTYQEFVLSRRILIFTESEIFYHCVTLTHRESRVEHWSKRQTFWQGEMDGWDFLNDYKIFSMLLEDEASDNTFKENLYRACVACYSTRQMSYGIDGLNAFTGVLKVIERQSGTQTTFGLPNRNLHESLIWRQGNSLRRRTETFTTADGTHCERPLFPSWTWAAWEGGVFYDRASHFDKDSACQLYAPISVLVPATHPLVQQFASQVLQHNSEGERELTGVIPIVAECAAFKFTAQKSQSLIQFTPAENTTRQFDREDPETKDLPTEGTFIRLWDSDTSRSDGTNRVLLVNAFELPLLRQTPLRALADMPAVVDTLRLSQAEEIPPSKIWGEKDQGVVYRRPIPCNPMDFVKDRIILASRISFGEVDGRDWRKQNPELQLVFLG
ncbi:hypothetical protein IFR05_009437 [Cadophora sp. M221]|nr:hypothetical protein IFR05_009437 [Cadophora sp. M221]